MDSRFNDENFEELGWNSRYLGHKVEQRTKRRTSANRGVDWPLRVDSDQVELAQALKEPARALKVSAQILDREQYFVACWWHGIRADSGFGRAGSSASESTRVLPELTQTVGTDAGIFVWVWDQVLILGSKELV